MEIAVHDIVYLRTMEDVEIFETWPQWIQQDEMAQKIAVVRRMMVPIDKVAIGFRGDNRAKRLAAITSKGNIERVIRPFEIVDEIPPSTHADTIGRLATLLADYKWGIGGSVGFTMATGIQTCHDKSDIDVILYCEKLQQVTQYVHLLPYMKSLGHRIDVQVEVNGLGAVVLEDYVQNHSFLLRTSTGPMLMNKSNLQATI